MRNTIHLWNRLKRPVVLLALALSSCAAVLRALCDKDCKVGYTLMRQAAIAAMERLHYTRVQLVAERV